MSDLLIGASFVVLPGSLSVLPPSTKAVEYLSLHSPKPQISESRRRLAEVYSHKQSETQGHDSA